MSTTPVVKDAGRGIVPCEFCNFLQDMMTLEILDPLDESRYLIHLSRSHGLVR